MTTKRGGDDPVLLTLRYTDCVLSLRSRIGGPSRARSILEGIGNIADGDPDDDQVSTAVAHKLAVEAIEDDAIRRVLVEAMDTDGCRRLRSVREVATACRLPVTTTHRLLRQGIGLLIARWDRREAA